MNIYLHIYMDNEFKTYKGRRQGATKAKANVN
jgi:hypothetical protein